MVGIKIVKVNLDKLPLANNNIYMQMVCIKIAIM